MADGENILLGRFNIDIDEVVKQAARLRKEMNELAEQQKKSRDDGLEETELYQQREVELKNLRAEYNKHIKIARELQSQTKDQTEVNKRLNEALDKQAKTINQAREQNRELNRLRGDVNTTTEEGQEVLNRLNKRIDENNRFIRESSKVTQQQEEAVRDVQGALSMEVKTIQDAREQNKLLNQLRNTTNVTTEEGRKELQRLNDALDKNNEFIKENVDQYTQQKINIGNYSESIQDAFSQLDIFNGGLAGMVQRSQEAGGVTQMLSGAFKQMSVAIRGAIKSSLAFIATPLGATLGAIGAAVLLVQNAMNSSEESTNRLNRAFAGLRGVLNMVTTALVPLGDFLIDVIVGAFEMGERAVIGFIDVLGKFLDALGLDEMAGRMREFNEEYQRNINLAREQQDAENELTKNRREARKVMLEYQRQAEELRQIRDDESRSIEERIQANRELGEVLQEQMEVEESLAMAAVNAARLNIEAVGETTEALDRLAEAETELIDIRERITGQRSEQLTNENSLLREQEALRVEALQAEIAASNTRLELYLLEQGERRKSAEQELQVARETRDRKIAIARQEFEATKKTEADKLALRLSMAQAERELVTATTEIVIDQAERELEEYRENLEQRKNEHSVFTEEWLQDEWQRAQDLLEQEEKMARLRLERGVINEQEYQQALETARRQAREAQNEATQQREEAERVDREARQAAEFELEMMRREAEGESIFNLRRAQAEREFQAQMSELDEQFQQGLVSQQNYEAQKNLLIAQSEQTQTEITRQEQQARIEIRNQALNAIIDAVGRESEMGKGMSIALATINTYEGITKALAASPPPFNYIAAAGVAAQGFKAVKDIIETDIPGTSSKGSQQAPSGMQGLNENVPTGPRQTNATVLGDLREVETSPAAFTASSSSIIQEDLTRDDNGQLIREVAKAVREGSREGTQQGSEEGITNLSENRDIQQQSVF